MFTGIVKGIGTLAALDTRGGDTRVVIDTAHAALGAIATGDSVAVSGVCLTAVSRDGARLAADISRETLARTTLGNLAIGSRVNLEAALRAGEPLGGHLVSGHVDGFGVLRARTPEARSRRLVFSAPVGLLRFIAPKGSVCVDGISLTVNEVDNDGFGVNIVPHTMENTTLGDLGPGDRVNLEVDMIARYLARLVD